MCLVRRPRPRLLIPDALIPYTVLFRPSGSLPFGAQSGLHRIDRAEPIFIVQAPVVGLGDPGDDQQFLGARHRDIEQSPMLLALRRFLVVMRLGDRAVTLVLAEREHRQFLPLAHRQTEPQPPPPRTVGRFGKANDRRRPNLRSIHPHHATTSPPTPTLARN